MEGKFYRKIDILMDIMFGKIQNFDDTTGCSMPEQEYEIMFNIKNNLMYYIMTQTYCYHQ